MSWLIHGFSLAQGAVHESVAALQSQSLGLYQFVDLSDSLWP